VPEPTSTPTSLVERKQRLVRERIVEAAAELFHARGFDNVSVSDIAAHAEVGRTTFFRYFGDKSEVLFAKEQEMLDVILMAAEEASVTTATTATEAVEQLRPIVLDLCERATTDPEGYARRSLLLEQHPELRARDAVKQQQMSDRLTEVLVGRGTDEATAVLAAQISLACYQTARRRAETAGALTAAARVAFEQALGLGSA